MTKEQQTNTFCHCGADDLLRGHVRNQGHSLLLDEQRIYQRPEEDSILLSAVCSPLQACMSICDSSNPQLGTHVSNS